jgi:hypothetical protein
MRPLNLVLVCSAVLAMVSIAGGAHAKGHYQTRTQSAAGAAMHVQIVHAARPFMWRIGCLMCILRPRNSHAPLSGGCPPAALP